MPELVPVTTDFLDTAPSRIVTEVTVLAPISACWELIADQASWVQWFDGMSSVKSTPFHWTEVGQQRTVNVNGLSVDETAISIIPEVEYAFMINKWPLPIATKAAEAIRLEDRTNRGSPRTHLTYVGAFELTSFAKPGFGLLNKQMSAAWGPALKQLGALAAERGGEDRG